MNDRGTWMMAILAASTIAGMLLLEVLAPGGAAPGKVREPVELDTGTSATPLPWTASPGQSQETHAAPPPPPAMPFDLPEDIDAMVTVPAGWFVMGSDDGKPFEKPRRKVWVDTFQIDRYEVTNFQYKVFVGATGYPAPPHWEDGSYKQGRDCHPVTNVTWDDALAYARFVGKRLPTEAEWEKACRGDSGNRYAYGDELDPTCTNWCGSGALDTVAVYEFPDNVSQYGARHMTGNVWEWVSDWFSPNYGKDGQRNPHGPACGTMHVSKGGSWTTDGKSCEASYRCRSLPGSRWGYCGFRCARSIASRSEIRPPGKGNMVKIPAGWFLMGVDDYLYSSPQRRIWLDTYYIDKTQVTNREYSDFCLATGYASPPHWHAGRFPEGKGEFPVINVSIDDARAYAAWAGKRLPTEAEWEKAARGEDGREYPWGAGYDPKKGNTLGSKIGHTTAVGSFPEGASPYGVLDMCGNVWEWVEGWFDARGYAGYAERNPKGPDTGLRKVLRGGTWSTEPINCKTYSRCVALPGCRWGYSGFRCVVDGGKGER